jgi:hypothetical protein
MSLEKWHKLPCDSEYYFKSNYQSYCIFIDGSTNGVGSAGWSIKEAHYHASQVNLTNLLAKVVLYSSIQTWV